MTETYRRRKDAGLCVNCGKRPSLPNHTRCAECKAKRKAAQREEYMFFVSRGICPVCRHAKARDGLVLCMKCAIVSARAAENYRRKHKGVQNEIT